MQKICVVCIANYCRSPVAEAILKKNLMGKAYVQSCGIDPLPKASMDPRSQKFLHKIGFKNTLHSPQRINNRIMKESDVIYALDIIVLMQLNKLFPKYRSKIKLLSSVSPNKNLSDPFHYNEEAYIRVMEDIKEVCELYKFK